jgi:thiamine pyrophosphate-dependent acetolactate synthase large subunit-like protein
MSVLERSVSTTQASVVVDDHDRAICGKETAPGTQDPSGLYSLADMIVIVGTVMNRTPKWYPGFGSSSVVTIGTSCGHGRIRFNYST